ncbi:hypothetical protein KK083_29980 [Fulvivirgaceae bacterium PWU4]|uniref:Uncharacterized protein n=1 Tax=Chryseosolibacter histidini TaxID=2782349 RepID=A0AAP2DTP9_9BACT|nr:hypothetical protein [Chryseosolibacter histidini]MBT1701158.1 hypothetical protein [Chryseosolibacter histidini]
MKNLSRYLILLIILSCTVNDPPGIDEIVSQGNYKIECRYQGCFGGGTALLEIENFNKATYTNDSGLQREKKQIVWNAKKDSLVREFFKVGITFNDTVGSCTTTSSYRLSHFTHVVKFDDLDCAMNEKFGALLE